MLPLGVVALRAPACCERRLGLGRVTALAPMLLAETQAAPRTLRKRADRWSRAPPAQSLLQAPCAASLAARHYTGTVRTADLATTLPPPRRVGQGDRGRHEGSQAEHRGHQHADEAREADEGCAPRPRPRPARPPMRCYPEHMGWPPLPSASVAASGACSGCSSLGGW